MSKTKNELETCPDVKIGLNHGTNLRLVISGKLFEDKKQRYIPLRITDSPSNRLLAQQRQIEIQKELNDGTFDPTLTKYLQWFDRSLYRSNGVITLRDLWRDWCEYRKPLVAASTYKQKFCGTWLNSLKALDDTLPVTTTTANYAREWLIANRNKADNIWLLSELEKATNRLINNGTLTSGNPFLGMSKQLSTARNVVIDDRPIDAILGEMESRIYYFAKERDAILDAFLNAYPHYYPFTFFRFHTGCRFEESTGIQWGDITEDCNTIVFRRTYSEVAQVMKVTKMGGARRFNCSNILINMLLAHRERNYAGNDNAIVFPNMGGRGGHLERSYISLKYYKKCWGKIIHHLYAEGIIGVELSPKHTRHTFVNLAHEKAVDTRVLTEQVGHSTKTQLKHYRDKTSPRSEVIST